MSVTRPLGSAAARSPSPPRGDSGIGCAMAVHYTTDGVDLVLVYFDENEDACEMQRRVEQRGRRCMLM